MPSLDLSPPPKTGKDDVDRWLQRLQQQVLNLTPKRRTWTPVLTCDTPGDLAVTYSIQQGAYWSMGSLILARYRIATSAFTHTTSSGSVRITGLPFTAASITNEISGGPAVWGGVTKANYTDVTSVVLSGESRISLSISGSAQAVATLAIGDFPTAGTVALRGFVLYATQ